MVDYESSEQILEIDVAENPKMIRNILVMDDFIDPEFCDALVAMYEAETDMQYRARVADHAGDDTEVVKLTKIYVDSLGEQYEKVKEYMEYIMHVSYKTYRDSLRFPIQALGLPEHDYKVELPTIKKYVAGSDEHIGPHSDTYMRGWEPTGTKKAYIGDRVINILFYLADVEVGGETKFFFDDLTVSVPPRKGRIVIFPPLWTHIHAGEAPVSSDKYICNGHIRASVTESNFGKGEY